MPGSTVGFQRLDAHVEVTDQLTAREHVAGHRAEGVRPLSRYVDPAHSEGGDLRRDLPCPCCTCLVEPTERRKQGLLVGRVLRGVDRGAGASDDTGATSDGAGGDPPLPSIHAYHPVRPRRAAHWSIHVYSAPGLHWAALAVHWA